MAKNYLDNIINASVNLSKKQAGKTSGTLGSDIARKTLSAMFSGGSSGRTSSGSGQTDYWGSAFGGQYDPTAGWGGAFGNGNPGGNTSGDPSGGGGGGGYGYLGYGGGGGGGGASGPSDEVKAAGHAQKPLAAYGAQTILNKAKQGDKVYAEADKGTVNLAAYQSALAEMQAGAEYFSNLLKEQSAYDANRDKMGTARNGAGAKDLNTDMMRAHDATAATILETLEQNAGQIALEKYKALQNSINGANEMWMDTEAKLREGVANYVAQMNNMHPDLANGKEDGFEKLIDIGSQTAKTASKKAKKAKETTASVAKGIKVPQWLTTSVFDKNFRSAVRPELQQHIRPAAATQKAVSQNLMRTGTNLASAAHQKYWDELTTDYGHRRV